MTGKHAYAQWQYYTDTAVAQTKHYTAIKSVSHS